MELKMIVLSKGVEKGEREWKDDRGMQKGGNKNKGTPNIGQ